MNNKHLVTLGKSLCEKEHLQKLAKIHEDFFLEVWDKLIPLTFSLRYRSRKKITRTARRHTIKYIP